MDLTKKEMEELDNWFVLKITEAGTRNFNSDFTQWNTNNATTLLMNAVFSIADNMVGEKQKPDLCYKVACGLLRPLVFDKEKLFDDIKNKELGKEYSFPKKDKLPEGELKEK